jgi:malonate transporter and related proteins
LTGILRFVPFSLWGRPPVFEILNVIIPIFALMGVGFLAVRFKLYPAEGVKGLVAFVNNFATPCLLFNAMADADFGTAFNVAIIAPFYIGALFCLFFGAFLSAKLFGSRPGESVSAGFSAMFTNTVMVGIPVVQRAYGDAAMPVVFSIITFHASLLITVGMLTMELVRRDGAPISHALRNAGIRMVQNPLLWGVALGIVFNLSDLPMPEPADAFLTMMAGAVLPAALFGLGGALNAYRLQENWRQSAVMSALKLIAQPLIAYTLMVPVLRVDPTIARYGVLLAAMPAGINVYVFATYYNRAINVASNTVLISTVASILTISVWLYLLN